MKKKRTKKRLTDELSVRRFLIKMKLPLFLLMILFLSVNTVAFSQTAKISVNFTETPLSEVFAELGKQVKWFSCTTINWLNGNLVKLSDFKGKLVYMDIWATWCGPCVEEIPNMEKLYQHYKDDPRVLLVSVSVDSKKNLWEKKLDEDKPQWPQYIVDGALKDKLYNEYIITGIPRFMMFDSEGRIITINAMRPSNGKLIPFIEEQLSKPKEIKGPGGMKMIKRSNCYLLKLNL